MGKVVSISYASSLTQLNEYNSSFDVGVLRVCYPGANRNNTYIAKDDIERCLPSIYNCPIVCRYDRESDTFGGHDVDVVQTDDGTLRLINMTEPVGVIPESAKTWFAAVEEENGSSHEYLHVEVLIWKRQEAYQKIKKDGICAHSMEINVKDGETVDGVYHIKDFEFSAFTLIGVEPCFESSTLEMYSEQNFTKQYTKMMQEFKECFNQVNTPQTSGDDNILSNHNLARGGDRTLEEKNELLAQYGVNADSLGFSIEELSLEELRSKLEEMNPTKLEGQQKSDFELTGNVVDELDRILSGIQVKDEWGYDRYKYWYVDCDIDFHEVYCYDTEDGVLCGFTYTVSGDAVTIDFDSKKRKKWVIADFDGDDQQTAVFAKAVGEMNATSKERNEWRQKYQAASDAMASMNVELEGLRQYKEKTETAVEKEKRDAIFSRFGDLDGVEAFERLKQNCAGCDLETLEEKCYAIRGRNSTVKFSAEEKAPKIMIDKTESETEPYGGLFKEFGIKCNK